MTFAACDFPAPDSLYPHDVPDVLDDAFTGWVYHQFMRDSCALTSSALIRREALEKCVGLLAQTYGGRLVCG